MNARRSPRVLIVDDEPDIRSAIGEILSDEGYAVALASGAAEARREFTTARPDLVLLDIWMEGEDGISLLKAWTKAFAEMPPVLMMSGHGTVDTAIEATRLGALDFIEKPVSLAKLLHMVEQALKSVPRRREPLGAVPLLDLLAAHPLIARLKETYEAALGHGEPVLFSGESGSGRETLARHLARAERRAFIRLTLAGAEASDVATQADHLPEPSLLFLDELGEASAPVQEALIVLLSGAGDARLRIAASLCPDRGNSPPAGLRRELYDRLAAFPIEVPPLRAYHDYLPEIVRYYVDDLADGEGYVFRRFGADALNRLRRHGWPGNLRELNNVLKRLLGNGSSDPVGMTEVDAALGTGPPAPSLDENTLSLPFREARDRFERAYLEAQLALADGRVAAVAERVGLERTHLYRKLRSLGIELPGDERGACAD